MQIYVTLHVCTKFRPNWTFFAGTTLDTNAQKKFDYMPYKHILKVIENYGLEGHIKVYAKYCYTIIV